MNTGRAAAAAFPFAILYTIQLFFVGVGKGRGWEEEVLLEWLSKGMANRRLGD